MIETHVLLIVLLAAALHATWNALVDVDKLISMTAVVLGHVPFALLALPFVPLPDAASNSSRVSGEQHFTSATSSFCSGPAGKAISPSLSDRPRHRSVDQWQPVRC